MEQFQASGSPLADDLSLVGESDVCFYHVSDSTVSIHGDFDIRNSEEFLSMFWADWLTTSEFCGMGSFEQTRRHHSGLRWHSSSVHPLSMFQLTMSSPNSSLPVHRAMVRVDSRLPQIVRGISTMPSLPPAPTRSPVADRQIVRVDGPRRDCLLLLPGVMVELEILAAPMIVAIPRRENATVSARSSEKVVLDESQGDFGFYFKSAPGSVTIEALDDALIDYFAIPSNPMCKVFVVSTFKSEQVVGSGTTAVFSGDMTVNLDQHVCLYHISDTVTAVSGLLNTVMYDCIEVLRDELEHGDVYMGGQGNFSATRFYYAGVEWWAGFGGQTKGFTITFESPGSSLPAWRGTNVSTSNALAVVRDLSRQINTGAEEAAGTINLTLIAAAVAGVAMMIVIVAVVVYQGRNRVPVMSSEIPPGGLSPECPDIDARDLRAVRLLPDANSSHDGGGEPIGRIAGSEGLAAPN